ncbi:hypothetical protein HPO96_08365 [Kribbella sandramycini]|uniref:Putative alkaline shock family protein YloU n=1 Tax=Kribbella sandramycini TaxID=60450 RepID=A0A7Y4KX66_9ACTN|nr:hypothetical protein [Kribbella sandramycini]MBB6569921.1 putative alkaline shock family protein YloU [Kribbella sandramycini]NOL40255.1 hypothetical protein [Kribbella sandramycini]
MADTKLPASAPTDGTPGGERPVDGPGALSAPAAIAFGGDRGRLEISARAVERIVEITARRHPATSRQPALLRRGLPKAQAVVAGTHVRLHLETAITWPNPLTPTATDLRATITEAVESLTNLSVDRADITITTVDASGTEVAAVEESSGEDDARVVAGKRPVGAPAVTWVGLLGGLGVVLAGCWGIWEMALGSGLAGGGSWVGWGLRRGVTLDASAGWVVPAGVLCLLVGVGVLGLCLRRRRGSDVGVGEDGVVWVRGVERIAVESAREVDSVTAVSGVRKRRRVEVAVTTFGAAERVAGDVERAVSERLKVLKAAPRTRIVVREE